MATVIYNVAGLQAMADDLTADYELYNDINASATSTWNDGAGFDPIGDWDTPFTGSFDGKGYTINDLYINRPDESYIGLFGMTGNGCGAIQNVGFVDCNITGEYAVAALIGFQDVFGGAISKCFSSGSITGATTGSQAYIAGLIGYAYPSSMADCYSTCSVTASTTSTSRDASECGGLIGSCFRAITITRCFATGDVTVTGAEDVNKIGGFIGYTTDTTIEKCYATGDVSVTAAEDASEIGGFIGSASSDNPINNCYTRGDVTATGDADDSWGIGGFVGSVGDVDSVIDDCYSTGLLTITSGVPDVGGFCGDNGGTITNCFWDITTSGTATSDGGTGKTTGQMKTRATFTDAGWNFDTVWHMTTNRNDGYPLLQPVGFGHLWGEVSKLHFIAELGEQRILGGDTTTDATAGHLFVEGDYLHYIDASGNERRQKGRLTGGTGVAGHIWIDDLRLRYSDSSGNERYLGTWILGGSKLGVDTILHA